MSESMWVVSKGEYSDYRVLCVCPSRAAADSIVAKANAVGDRWETYFAEELPVFDGNVDRVETLNLQVEIYDDGHEDRARESTRVEWPFDSLYGTGSLLWRWVRPPCQHGDGGRLEVWGTDHERVRKVYGDMRARLHHDDAFRMRQEVRS